MIPALEISNLGFAYGGVQVTKDISLSIEPGSRHSIIGPNGAGKTTFFNLLSGWLIPAHGSVVLDGKDITGLKPNVLARHGLARSFQITKLFSNLSVRRNLRLAALAGSRRQFNFFRSARAFGEVEIFIEEIAEQMELQGVLDQQISELSYGQGRTLEVAMTLCSKPRVVLLDEPAAGTSPGEKDRLVKLISQLPRDVTILLVEHDMDIVFELSDTISVLCYGELIATGAPCEIRQNAEVKQAYLGSSYASGH